MRVKHRKWTDTPIITTTPEPHVPHVPDYVVIDDKPQVLKERSDEYKINITNGIVIPDDLLLTVPLGDISVNLLSSFSGLQEMLGVVSTCESAILSSVATNLLVLLKNLENNFGTLTEELSSLREAIPGIFSSVIETISSLEIGTSISDAVVDVKMNLLELIHVLDEVQNSEANLTKKFNDAVVILATSVQVIIVSIAVIAEKAALNIGTVSLTAKELIASLTLILNTTIFIVQSVNYEIASRVPDRLPSTSSALHSFLLIVDRLLAPIASITTLISSSVKSSLSLVISTIGVALASLTQPLNASIERLLIGVVLEIPNNLESILYRLIGSHEGFARSVSTSIATITSCISVVSASQSGLQVKIVRQLHPVFRALSQLRATDDAIITEFISSLSVILDKLKVATNGLIVGVGVDIVQALTRHIDSIFETLKEILYLVNHKKIHLMSMDRITKECAKTVQLFRSVIVATSSTIGDAISYANEVAFEAVLAMQFLHSTVLYVVEWITAVSASTYLTKAGKTHELVASLAVVVAVLLQQDSRTIEMIAGSVNLNISDVVSSIAAPASLKATTANAAIERISQVATNTTVSFEQISSGRGSAIAVEGIVKTTEGDLPQILNGLTGSLSSISKSFSSSLSRLQASLKQTVSSDSEVIQAISGALVSILTKLSQISGPATQILSLTSNSLNLFFGHLLEASSRLSALGDICVSLSSSVAEASSALHSFIYAVNDYNGSVHVLYDSVQIVAKNVQVLISTFFAIVQAAANANDAVQTSVSVPVAALPYIFSTIILVVQQVVGAAIPTVSLTVGSISTAQHELTLAISEVLENITTITADMTTFVAIGVLDKIPSNILLSVSDLHKSTSSSLSKISGIVANIQVSLSLADQAK